MRKISAGEILLFELCPNKWWLTRHKRGKHEQLLAFYRFSSALHDAARRYFNELIPWQDTFRENWNKYRDPFPLVYRDGETWESLLQVGLGILEELQSTFPTYIEPVVLEHRMKFETEFWVYTGQPDMVAFNKESGRYVVLDYKTTNAIIPSAWVRNSIQLTGGVMLAAQSYNFPLPMDVVVCNLKTSPPGVHWLWDKRTSHDIEEFKRFVNAVVFQMDSGRHFKRSLFAFSTPCSWCDVADKCSEVEHIATIDGLAEFASLGGGQ